MYGGGGASSAVVEVAGPGFSRALRLRTGTVAANANAWDVRARCFSTAPVNQGDTVLARFWMRTVESPAGKGITRFVIEKGASPYTKSVEYSVAAGAEWKLVEVPFHMAETYSGPGNSASGYNASFWVTFPNQVIELGGIELLRYGAGVSFWSLGLKAWPYAGYEEAAPWRAAAAARIEKNRKTDIAVAVRDAEGRPVAGAAVHIRMKRHAFGFGTAVAHTPVQAQTEDGRRYRETVPKMFNKIVTENVLKWPAFEGSGRAGADAIFAWLPQTGIQMRRGHVLVWPGARNLPADVAAMLSSPAPDKTWLRERIDAHIRRMMEYTKGKVTEWDVVNEPYTNKDVMNVMGDEEMVRWFQIAREADPSVKLYINDYNNIDDNGLNRAHLESYLSTIRFLIDRGAPLDGIGLQGHFGAGLTDPEIALEILDRFAAFGKDLQITEFDINIRDERLQAAYTRDFLTVCFSHPAVKGFMVWGFWAGAHWRPDAAMIRRDWTTKPNYDAWMDLIYRQWWTDVRGATGADGVFRTRGFLGDYEADIEMPSGEKRTIEFTAAAANEPVFVAIGPAAGAGRLTREGVVNAASFRGGAVAPGETVTLFGEGIGSPQPAAAQSDSDGNLPRVLAGTRVLFDGRPAPVLFTSQGQVNAIVPYGVSGVTRVEVESFGVRSNAVELPVAAAAPGIYTYSGGAGQAVAVNQDGRQPVFNRDRPLPRGQYVTFFATGEGALVPAWTDGRQPAPGQFPRPANSPLVRIGGVESRCEHNWSGLIHPGVLQLNACVPHDAPAGDAVPLEILVSGAASQPGVTLRVQ